LLSEPPRTLRRHDLSSLQNTTGAGERTPAIERRVAAGLAIAAVAFVAASCNKDSASPTSPTSTNTATVTAASVSEDFTGTVPVGGSAFYSFSVAENGTVAVTYTGASGNGVPGTVWLGLGIGTPSAEDCATGSTVNTPPATAAQISGTYAPGIYCVKVSDIGNLYAPATFSVTIAHP
jgi:hypothetical protein